MNLIELNFEKDDRFFIYTSTIPKAGFGLFAKKNINKGDKLYVFGIKIPLDSDFNICTGYARNYKFADPTNSKNCIMPLNYAGMINQNLDDLNATINNNGKDVYFEFTRDINANEEIFTYYGDSWCQIDNAVMAFILSKIN